jgi:hypothetical protein
MDRTRFLKDEYGWVCGVSEHVGLFVYHRNARVERWRKTAVIVSGERKHQSSIEK